MTWRTVLAIILAWSTMGYIAGCVLSKLYGG